MFKHRPSSPKSIGPRARLSLFELPQRGSAQQELPDPDAPQRVFILRCPVTAVTEVLAVAMTFAWLSQGEKEYWILNADWWPFQMWRPFTATLLHVGIVHLLFNLYWLSHFGVRMEFGLGRRTTLGLYLLFAAGSALAQYAFGGGGVGLSGVVFGQFGLLWVLSRRMFRFGGAVTFGVTLWVVFGLSAGFVIAVGGINRIGNVAHATGLVLGVACGYAMTTDGEIREWLVAAIAGAIAIIVVNGAVMRSERPMIKPDVSGLSNDAYEAAIRGEYGRSIELCEALLRSDPENYYCLVCLSYAYERLGRSEESAAALVRAAREADRDFTIRERQRSILSRAYERLGRSEESAAALEQAARVPYRDFKCRQVLARLKIAIGDYRYSAGRFAEAEACYAESVRMEVRTVVGLRKLGLALSRLGRHDEALWAARRAMRIEPYTRETRELLGFVTMEAAYQRFEIGEIEHAIELYREGMAVDSQNAIGWHNLGLAYLNLDQKEAARTALTKAVALEPMNEDYRNALGYIDE